MLWASSDCMATATSNLQFLADSQAHVDKAAVLFGNMMVASVLLQEPQGVNGQELETWRGHLRASLKFVEENLSAKLDLLMKPVRDRAQASSAKSSPASSNAAATSAAAASAPILEKAEAPKKKMRLSTKHAAD